MTIETIVKDDKVVTIETIEHDRVVDFDDIEGHAEPDDCYESPWSDCDGWEHEFSKDSYYDHEGREDSYARVNRTSRNGGSGYIEIDDDQVVKWGCTGPSGCSKQVRFEAIAAAKRKATIQLVKWYEDGWYNSVACATYGDYSNYLGGIIDDDGCSDYLDECILECRMEVAAQMECDGYEVVGQPSPPNPYNRVDAFKRKIRYNLTGVWS